MLAASSSYTALAMTYPPRMSDEPIDENLRLAIIQALLNEGVLPKFDREAFMKKNAIESDGDNDDPDYRFVHEIQSEILSWLLPEHLPRVKSIEWAGGQRVQHWIWSQWDGESDEFDVQDLTGIGACTALTKVRFDACCAVTDLTPLTKLASLEELVISGRTLTDVAPLARVPRLRALKLNYHRDLRDLTPLAGHASLETLDVCSTGVTDLAFATTLPKLRELKADEEAKGQAVDALTARGVKVVLR
jgi:hypothetical protein